MTLKSATVWRFERVYETLTRFLPPESLNTILSQLMTVIKLSLCSDIKLNLSLNQNSICSSGSLWSWGHLTLFRNDGEGLHHIFKELRESIPTVMRWEVGTQPGQVTCPSHTHYSLKHSPEPPVKITCMFRDCGRELETLQKVPFRPCPWDYRKFIVWRKALQLKIHT